MLALRAGAQLGNYQLVRAIGSGGMGVVFEAHHEALGRQVAIKVLHALAAETPKSSVARARFLREGRAAAQVRHPHVVDVFDFGVQDGTPFLVMELVQGESLAERLEREKTLSLAAALEVIFPVLSAVGDLHAAGIIHRDLKPANILLGRGRGGELCPKVADFGVSRLDDSASGLTDSGVVVGTYSYMPPEQALGSRTVTDKADQYALGAILYECLTGRPPFEGESAYEVTHAILHAPLVRPAERAPALPAALDGVILRALAREPEARFQCVEELGGALLEFAAPDVVARWAGEFLPSRGLKATATIAPVTSIHPAAAASPGRQRPVALWLVPALALVALLVGRALIRPERAGPEAARPQQEALKASPLALAPASSAAPERSAPAPVATAALPPPAAEAAPPEGHAAGIPVVAARKPSVTLHTRAPKPAESSVTLDNGAPLLDPR